MKELEKKQITPFCVRTNRCRWTPLASCTYLSVVDVYSRTVLVFTIILLLKFPTFLLVRWQYGVDRMSFIP